eukprot:TRINITY_DN67938_c1_g3_i1.p1 TRINITY_DN67938_c1_g3~~TRINITY_DN67938_c1_g3_i1.p1  ORF type:complete len:234 (-),score=60.74 TRINITY_DN67938_c1_g3_i1:398-1099(-)
MSDDDELERRRLLREESKEIKKKLYEQYGDQIRMEMEKAQKEKQQRIITEAPKTREQMMLEVKLRGQPVRDQLRALQDDMLRKLGDEEAAKAGQPAGSYTGSSRIETLTRLAGAGQESDSSATSPTAKREPTAANSELQALKQQIMASHGAELVKQQHEEEERRKRQEHKMRIANDETLTTAPKQEDEAQPSEPTTTEPTQPPPAEPETTAPPSAPENNTETTEQISAPAEAP